MNLKPIPDYCEHMTIEEFIKNQSCMIMGEDGSAYYATATECSSVYVIWKELEYKEYPTMFTHICWFNK